MAMAVKQNQRYVVRVTYKPEFDTTGTLDLEAYTGTFSKVKEDATVDQLKAFADALMSLTIYRDAPYKIELVDTSTLTA